MEIQRKDKNLSEAIELLDKRFEDALGDTYTAYNNLTGFELNFIDEEIRKCATNFRYYAQNYHTINSKHEGIKTLYPFFDSQEIFYNAIVEIQRAGKPVQIVCLKARQLGLSTVNEALILHKTIFTEGSNTLIVAQDPGQADYLFDMSRLAYECLPWWMRPEARYEAKGRYLHFDRRDETLRKMRPGLRSAIYVEAANKMCLCPGTMVQSTRGLIPIETIRPGDSVYNPNHHPIEVVAAIARKSPSGSGRTITAWYNAAFPISGTSDHGLMTLNGLTEMQKIKRGDKIVLPFRKITSDAHIPAPRMSNHAIVRLKSTPKPKPNREWGFLCGLYLAEGCVGKNNGRPVSFGLSISEHHLAERASRACGVKLSSPRERGGGLVYVIHSSWLGTWLSQEFGCADDKTIPDWVWGCGPEFCIGLMEGLILGDGHQAKSRNDIIFVTVRPALAILFREMALSIGFGLGGIIKSKTRWEYEGKKNTGVAYRVEFGGDVGISIRTALGMPVNTVHKHLRNHRKWGWIAGGNAVWLEVKKVGQCPLDVVYDIQVDSEDHLYLLPSAVTHNSGVAVGKALLGCHMSELSLWPDAKVLAEQIFPTLSGTPEQLAVLESTARGRNNFWHDLWVDAVKGKVPWTPVFIEFFRLKKYSAPIPANVDFQRTPEENKMCQKIKETSNVVLTNEQVFWRRQKLQEFATLNRGDESKFYQEFPSSSWQESFQGSGICAFNKRKLQLVREMDTHPPLFYGEIDLEQDASGKWSPRIKLIKNQKRPDGTWPMIPPAENVGSRLYVWEEPVPGASYNIGVDVAHGVYGGDYSCAQIIRLGHGPSPDVQVAEWHGWINPTPYGNVVAALGYWYNTAQLCIECNDVGLTTNNQVTLFLEYPNLFRWKHYDKIKNRYSDLLGWYTNVKTRDQIIAKFREFIDDSMIVIRNEYLLDECMDFSSVDDSRFEGQSTHDDRVFAMMIAIFCAHDLPAEGDNYQGARAAVDPEDNFCLCGHTKDKHGDGKNAGNCQECKCDVWRQKVDFVNTEYSPTYDGGRKPRAHPNEDEPPADYAIWDSIGGTDSDKWQTY